MADSATEAPTLAPAGPAARRIPGDRGEIVASVAESFSDLQRTVRRSKARLLAAAGNDVESAIQVLLHTVAAEGPMRASALAASVHADLSTVSRQVTALVVRGLLERRADQGDGRATLLAVTDAGLATLAEQEQRKQAFFDEVLTGWSAAEMHEFGQQMERFTACYDRVHAAWISGQAGRPDHPASAHTGTTQRHHPSDLEEGPHA